MFDVVRTQFSTRLQARWSIVFDELEVPWVYKPTTFTTSEGQRFQPAFWLPRERYWFDPVSPHAPRPAWWEPFSSAACAMCEDHAAEEIYRAGQPPSPAWPVIDVEDRWKATLVCLHRGLMPDGRIGPSWCDCAWENAEYGMDVGHDGSYQWVLCPDCGLFGCEFMGRAERLSCSCRDSGGKDYNCGDPRLLAAYQAAQWADLGVLGDPDVRRALAEEAAAGWSPTALDTTARARRAAEDRPVERGLIRRRPGGARAAVCDTGRCRSLAEVWRLDCPRAPLDMPGAAWACSRCDGYVCATCAAGPAFEEGGECQVCAPTPSLTHEQACGELNRRVLELARGEGVPIARVHAQVNREMRVRTRGEAGLEELVVGLNAAGLWLEDRALMDLSGRQALPTVQQLALMTSPQLRAAMNEAVHRVAGALGYPIPMVHYRVNTAMKITNRPQASAEDLRLGLRHLLWWLEKPGAFDDPVRHPVPGGCAPSQKNAPVLAAPDHSPAGPLRRPPNLAGGG